MKKAKNGLDETTHNKTYKLAQWRLERTCCTRCRIRGRRTWYYLPNGKYQGRFPSWKLVSKNKKQYEKKHITVEYHNNGWTTMKW